ncbi:DMT family transporter [Actibacterium sp. 188UL27-1]|uniref:DMT family transporter n=1 Tax=Actibacterium sp. 188UL27-1 TaxID=2786961 RepID=UPI001957C38C|nr:DMT family transporter [Actibacterium sp. 188UL27-1]MBM7068186.1 DMT family transporter [Actibacterium sp. 188UL27-1]
MTSPSPDAPGLLNWLLILFLGVIWGAAFLSVSFALDGFGPWTVAAGRVLLGATVLAAIGTAFGQGLAKVGSGRAWLYCAMIGWGAVAMPFGLLAWGQQHVASAFAGVAMGCVPLLVLPLVAIFSPEEGIGPRRIIGLILGFVGLLILVGPAAFQRSGASLELWGQLACIGAAGCYAIGSVLTRRAPQMPPLAFASGTLVMAAALLVPLALWQEGLPADWPATPLSALIYAALFPTALASVIRVRVITTAGSLFMSLTSYMVPVWSVIFGITLRGEALSPSLFLALALILAGIAVSQSRALIAFLRR